MLPVIFQDVSAVIGVKGETCHTRIWKGLSFRRRLVAVEGVCRRSVPPGSVVVEGDPLVGYRGEVLGEDRRGRVGKPIQLALVGTGINSEK